MNKFSYLSFSSVLLLASFGVHATTAGSCNNAAGGFCNEFNGNSYKADRVEKSCQRQGMKFLSGACPVKEHVGSCTVFKGKNTESQYHYYSNFPGYGVKPKDGVAAEAARQCSRLKGVWVTN